MKLLLKYILYFFILIYFVFTVLNCVYAQGVGPLPTMGAYTLNQAVRTAIVRNPYLHARETKTGISAASISAAKAITNPFFTFEANLATNTYAYGLTRTFIPPGIHKYQTRIAEINYDIDLLEAETERMELIKKVREAYVLHYNSLQILAIYQEVYNIESALLEKLKTNPKKETKGKEHLELIQAEDSLLDLNDKIQYYKYHVITTRNELEKLLGEDLPKEIKFEPSDEIPPALIKEIGGAIGADKDAQIGRLTQIALKTRPVMLAANKYIQKADYQKDIASLSRVPILILLAAAYLDYDGNEFGATINGQLELPVFNSHKETVKEAESNIKYFQEQKESLNDQIYHEVKTGYNATLAAKETLDRYKSSLLAKNQELRDEAISCFNQGNCTINEVIGINKSYVHTKIAYFDMVLEYENALSDLEKYVGKSFVEEADKKFTHDGGKIPNQIELDIP